MADSIVGAVGANLSDSSKSALEALVSAIAGEAAVVDLGGSTAVFGADASGNSVGSVTAATTAVSGAINDANLTVNIELPVGVGLDFAGPSTDQTAAQAKEYFDGVISQAFAGATGAAADQSAALSKAFALIATKDAANTNNSAVRLVNITNESTDGAATVKLSGDANSSKQEVVAVNASQMRAGQTLQIENLDRVVVAGSAKLEVVGSSAAFVAGDNADQNITGGGGSDTLVGGGGNDTLAGGAGADDFGFVAGGNFTISDLSAAEGDKLAFSIDGLTSIEQLVAAVTAITETADGVTFQFGDAASITLVGMQSSDVTADLIKLTL